MTPRFPRRGTPESFGCVRDPERDRCGPLAWERPDGSRIDVHHDLGTLVQTSADVLPEPETEAVKR